MEDIECCRHSKVALRCIVPPRRCAGLACRVNFKVAMLGRAVDLPSPPGPRRPATVRMSDHPPYDPGPAESVSLDLDAATRRLMAALDALERAVERRREADRDEDELATRIQALGADRSRLADELDGSLVKTRKLERANREIAERLDAAIGAIRSVLQAGETS